MSKKKSSRKRRRFGHIWKDDEGVWHYRYHTPDGRRPSGTTCAGSVGEQLAEAALAKIEADIAKARVLGEEYAPTVSARRTRLDELAEDYLRIHSARPTTSHKSAISARSAVMIVVRALGPSRMAGDVTPADAARCKAKIVSTGIAGTTVNRYVAVAKALFRHAVETGHVLRNPFDGVRREPKEKRAFPHYDFDEQDGLLAVCYDIRPLLGSAAKFLIETGLRSDELNRLRWDEVRDDDEEPSLLVRKSKNRRARRVEITPRAKEALAELRAFEKKDGRRAGHVWPRQGYTSWSYKPWKRARAAFGLPELHMHDLRHLFGCNLLAAGVDIRTIQNRMGHVTLLTTLDYVAHAPKPSTMKNVERLRVIRATFQGDAQADAAAAQERLLEEVRIQVERIAKMHAPSERERKDRPGSVSQRREVE